jgi:hypothetical protein
MPFDDRFTIPRDGHELTCIDAAGVVHWCVRCGALWLDRKALDAPPSACVWESCSSHGRSVETTEAPPCRRSTAAGEDNLAADHRLMLRALTSDWICTRVLLANGVEGWHWSRPTALGKEAYAVPGRWIDGPCLDATARKMLLTASR